MIQKSFVAYVGHARSGMHIMCCSAFAAIIAGCPSSSPESGSRWGTGGTGVIGGTGGAGGTVGTGGGPSPISTGTGGAFSGTGGMTAGIGGGTSGVSGAAGGMSSGTGGLTGGTGGLSGGTGGTSGGTGGSGSVDPKCGASAHCQTANGMMVCVDNTTSLPPTCTTGGNECTAALPGSACAQLPTSGMGCVLGCGMPTANQCPGDLTCQNPFGMGAFCATSGGMPPTCNTANGSKDCAMYTGTVCMTVSVLTGCFKTCTM